MNAFTDLRNILFERELGTNILSELVTRDSEAQLLALTKELKDQIGLDAVIDLANVPDQQGNSVGLRLMSRLRYTAIQEFYSILQQPLSYLENPTSRVNIAHAVASNLSLNEVERLQLLTPIDGSFFNKFDSQGSLPLNCLIVTLA